VALAVGADITYSKWEVRDHSVGVTETFIVAEELQQKVLDIMFDETQCGNGKTYEFKESFKGLKLENKQYKPLFDFFIGKDLVNKANLYKVVTADFVSTTDGTGVVHIAPAFGEDDMRLGEEKQLSFIQHVGLDGRYTADVTPWAGQEVKPKEDPTKADVEVLKYLQSKNLYFDNEPITHSYPHCWRCDSPLLNYATSSWFVNITTLKDKLLKNAQAINWVPGHLKEGRFGMWLEGARDWSISRSRFWGNPMPVWKCDKCEAVKVLGGKDELETLTGEKVENIHKQYVDKLTFICEKCEGTMHRIPEVFDCWVESGAMPYGQMHYPFENKEKFEANFPAEFIAEGVDQTRAWFYVMHVLSVALFDKPAYKNVVVNGIVLAEDGKKMSKKLKNYPDPTLVIDKYGADALRYYLATSPVMRADDLCFSEKGVDEVYKKLILITSNILNFYDLFKTEKIEEVKTINVLDQWILAKLHSLIKEVTEKMLVYELPQAAKPINEFIDELSTWYVRRSRDRFKGEEKAAALFTLNQVLAKLALVMAPFTPYMAEHIWQRLGNKDSVHLQDWPKHDDKSIDEKVLEAMTQARLIVEAGLAARDEAGMKVRQPLAELFYTGKELSQDYATIMADELNVLKVTAVETVPAGDGLIIKEHPALKVALDTVLTPELKLAGHLRELVRGVNNLRKNAGLTPGDKVKLYWKTEASELLAMFDDEKLAAELKNSVLAAELINDSVEVAAEFQAEMNVNGMKVVVYLQKN